MKRKNILALCFFVVSSTPLLGQDLDKKEKLLSLLGDSILNGSTLEVRTKSNIQFTKHLKEVLKKTQSFEFPFSRVKNLSKHTSKNKKFRIYSWCMPIDGTQVYKHFGYIQIPDGEYLRVIELKDYSNHISNMEYTELTPTTWLGALYYKVIGPLPGKLKHYYILLGWNGSHTKYNRKVIEVLNLSNRNVPKFGQLLLHGAVKEKSLARHVFKYSKGLSMSVKYDPKKQLIIFDHLSQSKKRNGKVSQIGPDLSYDAYKIGKDGLRFIEMIEPSNTK